MTKPNIKRNVVNPESSEGYSHSRVERSLPARRTQTGRVEFTHRDLCGEFLVLFFLCVLGDLGVSAFVFSRRGREERRESGFGAQ
jgi:hypothetical protein